MGIQTDREERQWKEKMQDEMTKLECLRIVMRDGREQDKSFPWKTAQKYYMWVKYGNPEMEIK